MEVSGPQAQHLWHLRQLAPSMEPRGDGPAASYQRRERVPWHQNLMTCDECSVCWTGQPIGWREGTRVLEVPRQQTRRWVLPRNPVPASRYYDSPQDTRNLPLAIHHTKKQVSQSEGLQDKFGQRQRQGRVGVARVAVGAAPAAGTSLGQREASRAPFAPNRPGCTRPTRPPWTSGSSAAMDRWQGEEGSGRRSASWHSEVCPAPRPDNM